jgi:hypothetical protein
MRRPFAASWWCAVAAAATGLPAQDEAAFEALAAAAAKSFGLDAAAAATDFDAQVAAPHAFHLHLGALELLYPKQALASAQALTDLKQCALAVCDAQKLLGEWMTAAPAAAELETARKGVRAWIEGWRWPLGGGALPPPNAAAAAAQHAFTAAVAKVLSREPDACRAQVWLAPTRAQFAAMCGLLGAIAPENRALLWQPQVLKSSEAWACRPRVLQIVAMEYAPPKEIAGEASGVRMDAREKTGLVQHVVQRALSSLVVFACGDGIDRDFEAGLCQNLVVALLGENNARTGGSGRGAYAAAREQFVAGGASGGGVLPAVDLDSQWRATKGRDHFLKPLKAGQRSGAKAATAKEAQDRIACFLLQDDHGNPGHVVRAPFLGPPAAGLPGVPAAFDADYRELLRAYRSGFVHWLRQHAGKSAADGKQRFAALLRELAEGGGRVTFELACRRAFGERLSAEAPTPPSLEWRFLAWLAR